MIKKISVLGSTGSIGTQTLEIARYNQDIGITALAAGSNVELLEKQVREFHPKIACLWKEEAARELKRRIRDLDVKVVSGMEGLMEAACEPEAQIVVTAVVGMIGIRPTIAAMEAGKDIALANKETLVTAGHIIMPLAKKMGVKILPVDSEHSAIFQCLQGAAGNKIPKENSVTSIPLNFANIKCPSSWNRMIPPRISTASTIFIGFHSSFPVFIYGNITAR